MFDDINENDDGLIDNESSEDDNNSSESIEEINSDVENATTEINEDTSSTIDSDNKGSNKTEEKTQTDEGNSISADLIRGHINTIILRALYERDKYGYEIINDIESKSHGQYTLKQPTLYSALKRLENQGYIKAYWKTDEVTLGGRRKYFTLTESGKAITEKNLSEWEYSRTIIDSLISDKSFDFANPAPNPVDFSLLRDSVSRVPTVKDEKQVTEKEQAVPSEPTAQQILSQHPTETTNSVSFVKTVEYMQPSENAPEEKVEAQQNQPLPSANNLGNAKEENTQLEQKEKVESAEEAARRRTHENYLKLISEPVRSKPSNAEDIVPGSENINSDKLIYNNKPETERDYKNLIDGIFYKTVYNGSVQTNYHSKQAEVQYSQSRQATNNARLVDRGASDGVAITPSNERNASRATKTTYNKGLTMLKSSAVVLAILVLEAIFCFIFMDSLAVSWLYPTTILAIGIAQFAVFGILVLNGYGRHCVRPTSNSYISTCIILTIISILIIAMLAFLLNMNTALASDVLKMLVIPAITAINVTVFGLCFKLFLK
ncbi:MAG: PadR family transcriptional regulator [Candidatus Coproplasma sp.]